MAQAFLLKPRNPVPNAAAGSFIFILVEYVASVTTSSGGGILPFIMIHPNRTFKKFTTKQQIQCQLAIVGVLIVSSGCIYIIVFTARKVDKLVKAKLKKALTKYSNTKAKRFKSKLKVQFIPLA